MAQKLYDYFLKAGELGGAQARTRLSILVKMTSTEAKSIADDPGSIKLIEEHFLTVLMEFGKTASEKVPAAVVDSGSNLVEKLRRQMGICADLTASRSVYSDDLMATAERITEALVDAINVERASIWVYNKQREAIQCLDLYVRTKKDHSSGTILRASDFPNYFKAIATQSTLVAENAHTHPGTSEFSDVYLRPLGINAMLVVPIYANGEMIGVVCHEHTGEYRKWTTDEETFAYLMGNIVGMAIEKAVIKKYSNKLENAIA